MSASYSNMTEEEKEDIKSAFARYDLDGNGTLDKKEIEAMLRELKKKPPTKRQLNAIFEQADANGDGAISFEEFVDVITKLRKNKEQEILECFKIFDQDGNGTIDKQELLNIFMMTKEEVEPADVDILFDQYDVDGNGVIDFDEFIAIYKDLGI